MRQTTELLQRVDQLLDSIGTASQRLDDTSRRIVLQIARAGTEGRTLRVSDIVAVTAYGTAPTVLSRLKKLVSMGIIRSAASRSDGRARELALTPRTQRKLKSIAAQIRSVARTG